MYYTIEDNEDRFIEIEEVIDYVFNDYEDYDGFNEMLNDDYGTIRICGETFEAYDILKNMDEDAYDQAYNDYIDGIRDEAYSDLERMQDGEWIYVANYEVYCHDDEEDLEEEENEEQIVGLTDDYDNAAMNIVNMNKEAFASFEDEMWVWAQRNQQQTVKHEFRFAELIGKAGI